jgi:hypothetical protein
MALDALLVGLLLAQAPAPAPIPDEFLQSMARDLAQTAPKCWPFSDVLKNMRSTFQEAPVVRAVSKSGNAVVLFANDKTGAWTAFLVTPKGQACSIDSGTGFDRYVGEPA